MNRGKFPMPADEECKPTAQSAIPLRIAKQCHAGKSMSGSARKLARKKKQAPKQEANASPTSSPEDEPLAELVTGDPQTIVRSNNDKLGMFIVSLAAAYNDLKDLAAFSYSMRKATPLKDAANAEAGEWRGRRAMLERFSSGVLHELMRLIKVQKALLADKELENCVAAMNKDAQARWRAVVSIALGGQANPKYEKLSHIRNNASFHYYSIKNNGAAWERFFRATPQTVFNRHAYYSLGHSMETTRFHFADAARQEVSRFTPGANTSSARAEAAKVTDEDIGQIAKDVNQSLYFIIKEFLNLRNSPREGTT
ncbi:MAG: hypothetical protein R3B48_13905 [Kofleriaceae bacterium]